MPGFIEPCLSTAVSRVPTGTGWSQELKLDGYRLQAHISGGKCTLYTRRGYNWTVRFPTISAELETIDVKSAVMDGEVFVPDDTGRSDFHLLQTDLAQGRVNRQVYAAFDLLHLNGVDLREAALAERRQILRELIESASQPKVIFSESIGIESSELLKHVCAMKFEGVVSKRLSSPYKSGRQEFWLKTKCLRTSEYPIIAFVEKLGANPRRVASLYLGRYEGKRLLYAGKAQTGFKTEDLYLLRERLDPYITPQSPLSVLVKKPKATWVRPELLAEVQYSGRTSDGLLRAPVYKGLRDDLGPPESSVTMASPTSQRATSNRASGSLTGPMKRRDRKRFVPEENILQLLPDADPPEKSALKNYWKRVHKAALPYLERRPLKLVRAVHGTTFYHKGRLPEIPDSVHQLQVVKREGGEGTRVWIDDLEGLLGLVDMDVIEVHPWNATVDNIELADVMVFDLDPGEGVSLRFVIDTAFTLREILEQEGFENTWAKLTGGKGLHVMVPLETRVKHDSVRRRSRMIAERLAGLDPDRYTVSAALKARKGRLFIDYLRNGRGTTAVGAYSPRAGARGTIAVPIEWHELENRLVRPDEYTIDSPPAMSSRKDRSRRAIRTQCKKTPPRQDPRLGERDCE